MVGIFPACSAVLVVFTFVNVCKCFDWYDTHRYMAGAGVVLATILFFSDIYIYIYIYIYI